MPSGLLGIEPLDRVEIEAILDRAKSFQPRQTARRKSDQLRGRMIVNLFFEASTRTRTSFEIAAKRLGADAISITATGSSVSKGESLVDTLNTLGAMHPDAIVMRHAASGAPHFLARYLVETPIINAGDGTHEHPTQALLDARTILDRRPTLEGLRVAQLAFQVVVGPQHTDSAAPLAVQLTRPRTAFAGQQRATRSCSVRRASSTSTAPTAFTGA